MYQPSAVARPDLVTLLDGSNVVHKHIDMNILMLNSRQCEYVIAHPTNAIRTMPSDMTGTSNSISSIELQ